MIQGWQSTSGSEANSVTPSLRSGSRCQGRDPERSEGVTVIEKTLRFLAPFAALEGDPSLRSKASYYLGSLRAGVTLLGHLG